jgi:hypothetical protein
MAKKAQIKTVKYLAETPADDKKAPNYVFSNRHPILLHNLRRRGARPSD